MLRALETDHTVVSLRIKARWKMNCRLAVTSVDELLLLVFFLQVS